MLTVSLLSNQVEELWEIVEKNPAAEISVDLLERRVSSGERSWTFELDDYARWRLLEGLDDIGLTLRHAEEIEKFEANRPAWLPRIETLA